MNQKLGILILVTFLPSVIIGFLSTTVVGAIIVLPLNIGMAYAFIQVAKGGPGELRDLFRSLEGSYFLMHVWTLLKMIIFIFLWTLLVIPGIIKAYSYSQTAHILADDPSVKDAITASREMMNGHKLELFFLQLSFIGWALLSVLTLGLVWIFYAGPYYHQTMALYYLTLKERL